MKKFWMWILVGLISLCCQVDIARANTPTYNVRNYGANGDGQYYPNGWTTVANSSKVTAPRNLTNSDIGKKICIYGAGQFTPFQVLSASGSTVAVSTVGEGTSTPISGGSWIYLNGLNGVTPSSGKFWVVSTDGNVLTLSSDSHGKMPASFVGKYTSGGNGFGICALTASVASVTAGTHSGVLSTAASAYAQNNVAGTIGTDNSNAVNTALAAAQARGGTLYFPSGFYCIDEQRGNGAIRITANNVTLNGDNPGSSTICRMSDLSYGIQIDTTSGSVSGVTMQNFTLQIGCPVFQRLGRHGHGLAIANSSNGLWPAKQITIRNVEVFNTDIGILSDSNVQNSLIDSCYVHDTLADGIASYGYSASCSLITVSNCTVHNTGDDGISNNTYSVCPSVNTGVVITGNVVLNSGGAGIATRGSDNTTISNNTVQSTFLPGIICQAGYGFYNVTHAFISNNQVSGFGQAAPGPVASGETGGIVIETSPVSLSNNNTITGNTIGANPMVDSYGPAVAILVPGGDITLRCNNNTISNNIIQGPFLAVPPGPARFVPPYINGTPAIFVDNGQYFTITGNQISKPLGDAIQIGSHCTNPVTVSNNTVSP